MGKSFFIFKDGQEYGPVSSVELKRRANSGELLPDDQVRPEERQNWVKANKVRGLFVAVPVGPQEMPPPLPVGDQSTAPPDLSPPPPPSSPPEDPHIDQTYSQTFGMEDAGDFGIGTAVKKAVADFKSLDYGVLVPFRDIFSVSLLRKKAVQWVVCFGLFPLLLLVIKKQCRWSFEGSAWWLGGYFCLFWAAYFYGILQPPRHVWQRSVKWAFFTVVVGIPLLLVSQRLPIVASLYTGTKSGSLTFRLAGFVLGVGILEETCKALPLLFALCKKEAIPLKNGIFLGMMSGFGFALAEVVQYSLDYWSQNVSLNALAIAQAIDNSTDFAGRVSVTAFDSQMRQVVPALVEVSGNVLLTQIVRFMTLPLLHACWAGIVGWFIATASHRTEKSWPVVIVGIAFVAVLHGLYDTFSSEFWGIAVAATSLLIFMGYLASCPTSLTPTESPVPLV